MAIRRPPTVFSETISSADIADNAVTTDKILNLNVTTAKIADSQITAAKVAADVATQAELNVVSAAVDAVDVSIATEPHIRTGVLYPAVGGKGIDGSTTVTSFGTDFAITGYATLKYYYTDIKGSKPIKDPRIGAHFGSQRHKFTSLQKLEQETATHGQNVYSVDGREWCRVVDGGSAIGLANDGWGVWIEQNNYSSFFEVVGYFSDVNWIGLTYLSTRHFTWSVDGGSETTNTSFRTSVNTPLGSRYVTTGSLLNIGTGSTLGIHTLKFMNKTSGGSTTHQSFISWGMELIAQDTTSTTTKSQIQIPSQNVVSYGEKFTVAAAAHHYNPFAFKTDGTTAWASDDHNLTAWPIGTGSSTNIDTATSLGLAAWVSTNYYKPYNGGRVVKWIASDGTIKTSVNMMPPNARSIGNSASLTNATAKANASIANNTFYPTMEAGAIDHSLAEVAKTFYIREFGNGSANQGTGGTYADASMLSTVDDIAYVMDDGLTSLSGDDVLYHDSTSYGFTASANDDTFYITFIGTGFSIKQIRSVSTPTSVYTIDVDGVEVKTGQVFNVAQTYHIAQNLPYGTHIVKFELTSTGTYSHFGEFTFHQPKKPPIPEDAVVLADYMLMADFVANSTISQSDLRGYVSKGVRYNSATRDHFCDMPGSTAADVSVAPVSSGFGLLTRGMDLTSVSGPAITYFGEAQALTRFLHNVDSAREFDLFFNGTAATSGTNSIGSGTFSSGIISGIADGTGQKDQWINTALSSGTLGTNTYHIKADDTDADDWFYVAGTEIITPIHTSSHYQTFETPFLHELVGGDRNMEQNNLVVTPDGKTWDEVTRDVSYIGNIVISAITDTETSHATSVKLDDWRGLSNGTNYFNKDFAIAYDRWICLKDGHYKAQAQGRITGTGTHTTWKVNGSSNYVGYVGGPTDSNFNFQTVLVLKRGDYVQLVGEFGTSGTNYNQFSIIRLS